MKKLIIGLLVLTSCESKIKTTKSMGTTYSSTANHFDYNNHSYIEFYQGNATWGVHNPDCKCKNK